MSSRSRALCCAVFAVVLVLTLPVAARADFIQVISQTYHIEAQANGIGGPPFSYNETSSSPLARLDNQAWFVPGQGAGFVQLRTSATGSVTPASAFVEARSFASDGGDAFGVAFASASMTFQPLESQILLKPQIITAGPISTTGFGELRDETAGVVVLQFTMFFQGSFAPLIWLPLDTSHIYTMTVSGGNVLDDEREARLQLQPVPEASSLAMLSVGFAALFIGLRQRVRC